MKIIFVRINNNLSFYFLLQEPSSSQISQKFKLSLIKDVISIIEGPNSTPSVDYVMAAFSDLLRLWQNAIHEISKGKKMFLSWSPFHIIQVLISPVDIIVVSLEMSFSSSLF